MNLTRLLRGVLCGIVEGRPDIVIVGDTGTEDMLDATASKQPDVVVLGDGPEADVLRQRLRSRNPMLRVIVLGATGDRAVAYEPETAPRAVEAISPAAFLQMMLGRMQ